jgi:hypothetical protein
MKSRRLTGFLLRPITATYYIAKEHCGQMLGDIGSRVGIKHHYRPLDAGRDRREQLKSLARHRPFHRAEPSNVSARAGEARNESGANRVGNDRKYNGDGRGLAL